MAGVASLAGARGATKAYTPAEIGVLLFLAGEVMLFAGLLAAAIVLRADDAAWARGAAGLSRGAGALGTFLLLGASFVLARALKQGRTGGSLRGASALAALLGFGFLALQGFEYRALLEDGLSWHSGVFGSCFYVLTAVHGLHVLVGVLWLASNALLAASDVQRARLASWYWHLVDGVWIALFVFFYLA